MNKHGLSSWLMRTLTDASHGSRILALALFVTYSVLPIVIAITLDLESNFFTLAGVTALAVAALAIGAATQLFDPWFDGRVPRVALDAVVLNSAIWTVFTVFVFLVWVTAPQIPLIAALSGADPNSVAVLREQFLKAREGWQGSFVYINAVLSGALVPYSLALMFLYSMRWRWVAAGFFLIFCISFVEKAFFFKGALPILYLVSQGRAGTRISPRTLLLGTVGLLLLVTFFSGSGRSEEVGAETFFSSSYVPQGGVQHLIWRSVAIPLITAADAIRVLEDQFAGRPLWGATSSFIAGLVGTERIEFERLVFAAQWGQNETGTGSSNSVFITEAFVNFSWFGIALFGFLVGLIMRFFAISRDEAFRAIWPLFAFGVYTSGLIGLLLSNGFALLFFIALFFRVRVRSPRLRLIEVVRIPSTSFVPS